MEISLHNEVECLIGTRVIINELIIDKFGEVLPFKVEKIQEYTDVVYILAGNDTRIVLQLENEECRQASVLCDQDFKYIATLNYSHKFVCSDGVIYGIDNNVSLVTDLHEDFVDDDSFTVYMYDANTGVEIGRKIYDTGVPIEDHEIHIHDSAIYICDFDVYYQYLPHTEAAVPIRRTEFGFECLNIRFAQSMLIALTATDIVIWSLPERKCISRKSHVGLDPYCKFYIDHNKDLSQITLVMILPYTVVYVDAYTGMFILQPQDIKDVQFYNVYGNWFYISEDISTSDGKIHKSDYTSYLSKGTTGTRTKMAVRELDSKN